MFKLSSLSISKRLGMLTASAIVGIILLAALLLISERRLILEERQNAVRQTVETAHALVGHFQGLVSKGKMSDEEAKQAAMAALRDLRYSGNEYFWVQDMQVHMLM